MKNKENIVKKIAVLLFVLIFAATMFAGCSVAKLAGGIQPDSVDMPYEENNDEIDEELIYRQISSPEFRLYEEIVFCLSEEESPRQERYATVA